MHLSDQEARLSRLAEMLMGEGKLEEAAATYQKLLALNPNLPDAWYNLGYLERCQRHFPESIDAYRAALARHVTHPEEVHLNIAAILSEHMDRIPDAEAELQAAMRINPGFVPGLLNLGNLQEDQGRSQLARSTYEKVLQMEPFNGRATSRIARIEVFDGHATSAASRLRRAMQAGLTSPDDIAEMSFAMGHALDALGEFDAAFAAMEEANASRLGMVPPDQRYDAAGHERLVGDLIATFRSSSTSGCDRDFEVPIFICGMFRSGSTLAESIIAAHSRVTAGGELEFIPALVNKKLQPYPQSLAAPSREFVGELRATYLGELDAIYPRRDVVTDKRPDNFLHIGLIKLLFPNAKIIHTVRNPIDNILSIFQGDFDQSIPYSNDISDIGHWFEQYRKLMAHWKTLYSGDIFDLDYDELVSSPEKVSRSLIGFCGLDWEDACLQRKDVSGAIRTLSVWQVRQPLHARSSGRWRNYEKYLRKIADKIDGD